jgi:hypothetical protein
MCTETGFTDGYYWARHLDGTTFVVLREEGSWYAAGLYHALANFSPSQIITPIEEPSE